MLLIVHDPSLPTPDGGTIRARLGWNDPLHLAREYISDVRKCSHGYVNYQIVDTITADGFPAKVDGFRFKARDYLEACRTGVDHTPDGVDYLALIREFDMVERVDSGEIDEVWLFGGPFFGYWESTMAGPGAFWCNSPEVAGTAHCSRRFVIMGFSYERGVGEMLENLGHRAESILSRVFEGTSGDANLFERFTRYDLTHPGEAQVGSIHFAPNSVRDYDWGNPRPVPSRCDSWYSFPLLTGEPRVVTSAEWGHGDTRAHHRWWLQHLPHFVGQTDGVSWNWWEYIIDPNRA